MKPIIKLSPDSAGINLLTLSQSMKDISKSSVGTCPRRCGTRLLHQLVIRNNHFSIKHIFKLNYETDCDSARICLNDEPCKRKVYREFPGRQSYWSGEKKTLAELLCWCASVTQRDFNLEVHLDDEAYSAGSEPASLQELNEQFKFVTTCEVPDDSFSD